jgi:hypothetical protein
LRGGGAGFWASEEEDMAVGDRREAGAKAVACFDGDESREGD